MGRDKPKTRATIMAGLLALALLIVSGCGASQEPPVTATGASNESAAATEETTNATTAAASSTQEEYARALSAQGLVNAFIGEQFYDQAIEDEEGAADAVQSVIERLGGDETTKLEF